MAAAGAVSGAVPRREVPDRAPRIARLVRHGLPRFLLVGCAGLATDAAAFSALSAGGVSDAVARAASLAVATLLTWRLNRRFTFAASGRMPAQEALRYAGVALCAQGFNYGLFLLLRSAMPEMPALLSLVVSAGAAAAFSFTGQALVTFGSRGRPAEAVSFLGATR